MLPKELQKILILQMKLTSGEIMHLVPAGSIIVHLKTEMVPGKSVPGASQDLRSLHQLLQPPRIGGRESSPCRSHQLRHHQQGKSLSSPSPLPKPPRPLPSASNWPSVVSQLQQDVTLDHMGIPPAQVGMLRKPR